MKIKNSLSYLTCVFVACLGILYGMQVYQRIDKEKNQELINSIQNLKSNLYETNLQLDRMLFTTDLVDAHKKFEKRYNELRISMEEIFNTKLYKYFMKDTSSSIESDTTSLTNLFLMNDDKILLISDDINALSLKYYTYLPGLFTSSVYYQGDDLVQKTKDSVELLSEYFSSQVSEQLEIIIETVRLETVEKELLRGRVTVGIFLFSSIIVLLISILIMRPIRAAVKKFFDFAKNENDLTKRIDVKSRDELGDMAAFINKTFQHISQMIGAISSEGVSMAAVGEDLSCNMNESVTAINQISANIEGIKKQISNQSCSITETQLIIEVILNSIELLNGLVATQSANVEQSSSSIEEMVSNTQGVTQILKKNNDSIAELIAVAQQGKQQMGEVSSRIKEMAKNSQTLLEAGTIIQNVASQTNLLAMNAAIEAAHAGESGKGFAVVAVEIRKLAEESNRQGNAITSTLSNLKKSIDEVNYTALESYKRMELSFTLTTVVQNQEIVIKNAMDEQNSASSEVLLAIQEINQITNQVRDSVVQMRTGSHDVQERMNNLVHISEEITDGMKEMSIGVEQITESVNQVSVMSVRNKESIGKLTAEVGKFKIENV